MFRKDLRNFVIIGKEKNLYHTLMVQTKVKGNWNINWKTCLNLTNEGNFEYNEYFHEVDSADWGNHKIRLSVS